MGRSLNINHVLNADKLTKAQFKKQFTDMMKAKGYTSAKEEDAELCYELVFSADRKWVTILSEDDTEAKNKASAFARDLGMQVLSVELVDSDFAELTLIGLNGAPVDTMFLGEPYFDEVPEPSPLKWQTMLGIDWAKVEEIQQGDHTFAEDALCEFGEVIGCENMLAEFGEGGDNAVRVYFKKAGEKKLTYRTAYNKVFSEVLEPLGFVKTKTPLLYMRLNGEIINLIKIEEDKKMTFFSNDNRRLNRNIDVRMMTSTLYEGWLDRFFEPEKKSSLFVGVREYSSMIDDEIVNDESFEFVYDKEDPETLKTAVKQSIDYILKYVIPVFDEIVDLNSFLEYGRKYMYSGDLLPLYVKLNIRTRVSNYYTQKLKEIDEDEKKLKDILKNTDEIIEKNQKYLKSIVKETK